MARKKYYRPDRDGTHRAEFDRARKKIYATQSVCGICGRPVDFSLKSPHPMSASIDHIIPVSKGGHPSDIDNLQLAHRCCNRAKSDKIVGEAATSSQTGGEEAITNRNLPLTINWSEYEK